MGICAWTFDNGTKKIAHKYFSCVNFGLSNVLQIVLFTGINFIVIYFPVDITRQYYVFSLYNMLVHLNGKIILEKKSLASVSIIALLPS